MEVGYNQVTGHSEDDMTAEPAADEYGSPGASEIPAVERMMKSHVAAEVERYLDLEMAEDKFVKGVEAESKDQHSRCK